MKILWNIGDSSIKVIGRYQHLDLKRPPTVSSALNSVPDFLLSSLERGGQPLPNPSARSKA